ncbi:MAG: hypothetical protein KDA38_10535 [Planctomycetales bacterium]|nr:hypothetical protein [Planctomycetales bacterium]
MMQPATASAYEVRDASTYRVQRSIAARLWHDQTGSVISCEVILLTTVLVIGIIVGAKSFRDAAVTEWADYAQAIGQMDQSYVITGGTTGDGTLFIDMMDFCDDTSTDNDSPTLSSNDQFANDPTSFIRYGVAAEAEQ